MNIKRHKKLKREHLGKMFHEKGFTKGVEVGVCHGGFSRQLCQNMPGVHLTGVDDYDILELRAAKRGVNQQENNYQKALEITQLHENYKLVKKTSMTAVLDFQPNSLDFVFIDGGHTFDDVMVDIIEWGKRVKKGGIISGHDYYIFNNGHIIDAVNIYAKMHKIEDVNLTDERTPSFWFEKTWD